MNVASAPAKVILFGEHAVVHGQPAIAAPVSSLRAQVRVERAVPDSGITIMVPSVNQRLHVNFYDDTFDNTLTSTARLTLQKLETKHPPDLILILESEIPIGSGLGSGAAVATAIARALSEALDRPLPSDDLNALVFEIERAHHGTPSGIDNTVIVFETPVYFVRGNPMENIAIGKAFTLLIGDSGHSTPTHITVSDVRALLNADPDHVNPLFDRIGEITRAARREIEHGTPEFLGDLMNENHTLLQHLTVSSPALDLLCEAALDAGASGAKLSGGGRGGNMIALVDDSCSARVTRALQSAGATRVIKTVIGQP